MKHTNISENIFIGDSEMAALMRSQDWSQTSLGAVETWSQSLKTAVRIMLTSRQPMFVWWGNNLINLYNDAYRAILGGKHPEALGQTAAVIWQEIWDQVGPRAETALLENQGTYDEALLLIMERNGYPEETYYTFSYSPVPNDDGSTGGIICANTEDTSRIIGERQLALLKELAAKTADARTFDQACTLSTSCLASNPYDLPFAMIYLVDPEQQCMVLAGTCGIERGHLAVPETVALEDDSLWHFADVLTTHQTYLIYDLELQFPDLPTGAWNRSPYQAAVVPIPPSGPTGKAGVLVAALNPFRLFDDNYQGFLNLVSAQIAASIANAQAYEEERKRAEALAELDHAKTTFFSNVSHEFRTPLTLMLSPLEELLAGDELPEVQRQQLVLMHRNSLRLLKLVNTLLDFSRLEAGRVQAVYAPTDLATFTAELASVFRSAIEQAGLQLNVICEQLAEPVYVDRQMWEKIIFNLLSNAFKFTFSGAIALTLRQVQHQVELTVQDTGIGIPQAELPQLFERFHQVEGARGRTQEGSGIGLALVQELVRLHGGQVQVESIEGKGTTFTITIPTGTAHLPSNRIQATRTQVSTALGAAPYVEEALRWLPEEVGEQGSRGAEGKSYPLPLSLSTPLPSSTRLLLVDDNADMREYVKRLLSSHYVVETATDGIAALEAIADHLPDLVLTDVMMPRLDGFGLLNALRSDDRTREIPIILLSARAGEEAKVEGLEAGADDYLIKPFSARELLARVEATLKLTQLRQDAMQREQILRLEAETAKQKIETILSSINDGFYVLDRNWCFTYANDRLCQIMKMEREQILHHSIWDLFPDTVGTEIYIQFQRAFNEQTLVQFEYFYTTWNGWYEHRVYPSPDGLTVIGVDITERKHIEAELRESEARFRQMADTAPVLIWMSGTDKLCHYFNQPWLNFTGRTMEQEMGNGWLEGVHANDLQHCLDTYATAFDARQPFQMEYRLRRFDGAYHWIVDTGVPRFTLEGDFLGYIGSCIDIEDRKQTELEIQKFVSLADNSTEFISMCDLNFVPFYINEAGRQIVGLDDVRQYRDTPVREFFFPEDQDFIVNEFFPRVLRQGRAEVEIRFRNFQIGTAVWMIYNVFFIRDENDQPIGLATVSRNITERKQAELERELVLVRERHYIKQLQGLTTAALAINNSALSVEQVLQVITDQAASIIDAHQSVTSMTINQNWGQAITAFHLSDKYAQWRDYNQKPEGSGIYAFVCQLNHPMRMTQAELEAHPRWRGFGKEAENHPPMRGWLAAPLLGREGQNMGLIQLSDKYEGDFTEADEAILVQLAQMASVAMENARLYAAEQQARSAAEASREEAQAANRIKDEFLAVLSHELRSPLNPILGWSQLLQNTKLDEARTKQALATIERNAKLQSELIEDLLDVSRILQGKLSLTVSPINLALTIKAAIETVRLAAEAKSIQIEVSLDSRTGKVLGDSTRLQQVVWNLLSNAVKFTPAGGRVEVRLEQVDNQAQITITDTGKGISPDFLPYVFDYFRQADSATTRKFGGLGLGLAIVRHLVELHGGTVQAESKGEGLGATFILRLPVMPTQPMVNQDPQSLAQSLDLNSVQVLVVDDDTDTRDFIEFLLQRSGAKVITAASALEALTALMRSQPDVLLSDIGMPEMDGYMLMRQVRALPPEQGGQIPAIALTAYAGELNQQQALEAGFQQHIAKPIEPEKLIQAISTLLA
ncbi:response regulator [Anabaena sphaerica FACHB-251]|uniref:Circadian input-output histidine kinase CikA n=1 Tax=Anabaena sphaerica FACHB-251 TaxID=2692883 RepID=A0A927A2Z9_9NOST|nr:ATP-binding protein [Anabaena sphaerica]MBD2296284.1 response regulator [Anabaena sphaerica FACHB-251]